jgi:ankyrin repeat protein
MNAVEMGHPEVAEYLLKAGADVSVADKEGKTALQIAREKGDAKTISLLERSQKQ